MIRPADIRALRRAVEDDGAIQRLKSRLAELRRERKPFYLTREDVEPIFRWKLRTQYGRQLALRATNSDSAYRAVTQAAFAVRERSLDYEAEVRLRLLSSLRGVGVPVASAILALAEPERYCVIDFRGWRAMFAEDRRAFDVAAYLRYLGAIRELATKLHWAVQETDAAVWEYDRRHSGRAV